MNDEEIDDFKLWLDAQPGHTSYTQCRTFISNLLGINKAKAEIQMAQLQKDDVIKIIKTHKTSSRGRRVFLLPLESLDEEALRQVWDGSSRVNFNIDNLAKSVHDRTGHDIEDIHEFIEELADDGKAEVFGDNFSWK